MGEEGLNEGMKFILKREKGRPRQKAERAGSIPGINLGHYYLKIKRQRREMQKSHKSSVSNKILTVQNELKI